MRGGGGGGIAGRGGGGAVGRGVGFVGEDRRRREQRRPVQAAGRQQAAADRVVGAEHARRQPYPLIVHRDHDTVRSGLDRPATGLVDHCPPIEGEAPDCPSEAIRFCPICDGYEATDRRIGVLGNFTSGGAKALFLRTYTKDVSLFLSNEPNVDGDNRTKLIERNIYIVDGFKTIATVPDGVVVRMENGACHQLDALYPALGCTVRSELATVLGAACAENGNLLVDDHQRTTVDALYAAGDVVTDLHQLSVAFGHAAIAATDIHNRLPANPR